MIDPSLVRRLQGDLQVKIENLRESMGDVRVEGTSGGGVVKVIANGRSEIVEVRIKKEAIDPDDAEMLQDLIVAATNQALNAARKANEDGIASITGGMRFPGLSF